MWYPRMLESGRLLAGLLQRIHDRTATEEEVNDWLVAYEHETGDRGMRAILGVKLPGKEKEKEHR